MKLSDRLIINGKLITWRQRRCVVCGKFLGLEEIKYCKNCKGIMYKKVT